MATHDWRSVVVIIGAGFSGTMTAVNLLRKQWSAPTHIILIEKNEHIGLGVAYGTTHEWHYLNVHAANMSAMANDPDDLGRFLQSQNDPEWWRTYVQRKHYGQYIRSLLDNAAESAKAGGVELTILHSEAESLELEKNGSISCRLSNGTTLNAASVVLALGNASPSLPGGLARNLAGSPRVVVDPWRGQWNAGMEKHHTVMFLGTGLTMIDKALELAQADHEGRLIGVSRHGLLPQPHKPELLARTTQTAPNQFTQGSPAEAMRWVRQTIASSGMDWRQVIDSLRPHTGQWWQKLSLPEQKRFLRHLQCYWDIHRHRMAPQVAAHIYELIDAGKLNIMAARVTGGKVENGGLHVYIKHRHVQKDETLTVDWIINCTGAETRLERSPHPLLSSLWRSGMVSANKLSMGLQVTPEYNLVCAKGQKNENIFAIGPPLRGTFFETIAVPELRHQANSVAESIHRTLETSLAQRATNT